MALKQLNIKNRTYYFYSDLINIKYFDTKLLKQDKKPHNGSRYLLHWLCYKKDLNGMLIV